MTTHCLAVLALFGTVALVSGCDLLSSGEGSLSAVVDGAEWQGRGYALVNQSGRLLVVGQEEGCGVCRSISLIGGELFEGARRYTLERDSLGSSLLSYGGGDTVGSQYLAVPGSSSFEVTRYDAGGGRLAGVFSAVFVESQVTRPDGSSVPPDTIRVDEGRFALGLDRLHSDG